MVTWLQFAIFFASVQEKKHLGSWIHNGLQWLWFTMVVVTMVTTMSYNGNPSPNCDCKSGATCNTKVKILFMIYSTNARKDYSRKAALPSKWSTMRWQCVTLLLLYKQMQTEEETWKTCLWLASKSIRCDLVIFQLQSLSQSMVICEYVGTVSCLV